jgi:hypothetical protein
MEQEVPVKINGVVCGHATVMTSGPKGVTVRIQMDDSELADTVLGKLASQEMSFAWTDPLDYSFMGPVL